jgi:bifunctional enzyme CysN/CysC
MDRAMLQSGEFVEVSIGTRLAVAGGRDVKGLFRKTRAGKLANYNWIDSPYGAAANPENRVDTTGLPAEEAADHGIAGDSRN